MSTSIGFLSRRTCTIIQYMVSLLAYMEVSYSVSSHFALSSVRFITGFDFREVSAKFDSPEFRSNR